MRHSPSRASSRLPRSRSAPTGLVSAGRFIYLGDVLRLLRPTTRKQCSWHGKLQILAAKEDVVRDSPAGTLVPLCIQR
jgi:hypothetical protein